MEAPNLFAADATDRLILDTSADALAASAPRDVVVIGDRYGALTLAAADAGATGIRVHQDDLSGERALAANAKTLGQADAFANVPLDASAVRGARLVLLQLPRSLDALAEIADLLARHAAPDVVVFAGGRVKHMTRAMTDVLERSFGTVTASLAQQKSRMLVARDPRPPAEQPTGLPANSTTTSVSGSARMAPANAAPCAHTHRPRSSWNSRAGHAGSPPGGRGRRAISIRDFWWASVAVTVPNERSSTSVMARVMCLTRPPAYTTTSGAACRARTSAISASASSDRGSWRSTTRAPRTADASSGTFVKASVQSRTRALAASARSPESSSWCTRMPVAPAAAAASVSAP